MIIISGVVQIKPEMRETAVSTALTVSDASEAEAGCITYRFYSDLRDPNTFFLYEEWESEEALAAHFTMPHMATFQAQLPSLLAGEPAIKRYTARPMDDA